jgi:hypothetical protein
MFRRKSESKMGVAELETCLAEEEHEKRLRRGAMGKQRCLAKDT